VSGHADPAAEWHLPHAPKPGTGQRIRHYGTPARPQRTRAAAGRAAPTAGGM